MWMLVSYYLPGKRAPQPPTHLAYGPTLRAEVEEHHLTPPARRVGGRLSKGFSFSVLTHPAWPVGDGWEEAPAYTSSCVH